MHGAKGKRKRKQKGHLAFQGPFLHVLARSHENGTNGGLTFVNPYPNTLRLEYHYL